MVDCIGNTPLHCAAGSGHTEIVIDYLKCYYNGSYTLGKDDLIIILNSIGELKEKEKCKKFKRLLEEMKEEEVKDTSLIELLMIKIHRNLGENEEAWNLYCSFDQESSFYSYAIEEAKQLIIEYQEDSILKGLSSLNVSSNGQKEVVNDNKGVPNKHLPEEREALRRHKAESRFFDPKRNKKKLEMANFIKEIIDHRYRSKESTNLKSIDLEGKSARFIITAERLFQEKVIGLSNSEQPKLGIPSYSRSDYGRSFTSFGPFETYKIGRTKVEFQHRTESRSPSAQGIQPSSRRLGSGYLKDVGRYDEIYNFFKKLTGGKKDKEKKLADLMTEFIKSHKPITLDKLREIYLGANESDIDCLHRCCFLILEKEQAQWHSATCLNHESLQLGMSVIQARCFLLLKKGFLNFKKVFMNDSQFGVYSHKNILSNLEKVRKSCKDTEDLYKFYLQDYMEFSNSSTCVLTTEQAHKDLKEIYGGESDTSGEEYSTDSSSISPCSSLDSLEVKEAIPSFTKRNAKK